MALEFKVFANQQSFEDFVRGLDWDDAYVKECHSISPNYEADSTIQPSGLGPFGRVLIVLPAEEQSTVIEIFGFEVEELEVRHTNEVIPVGVIKRRKTELDFQAFKLICAAVGFRHLDKKFANFGSYYGLLNPFSLDGRLVEPYEFDWRIELDEASKNED